MLICQNRTTKTNLLPAEAVATKNDRKMLNLITDKAPNEDGRQKQLWGQDLMLSSSSKDRTLIEDVRISKEDNFFSSVFLYLHTFKAVNHRLLETFTSFLVNIIDTDHHHHHRHHCHHHHQ
uniref:Uncharacterized protein n=1 Tax=Glossina pallidipes TaxID=7398 RepID=A0A1A9ZYQ8_GLOPL